MMNAIRLVTCIGLLILTPVSYANTLDKLDNLIQIYTDNPNVDHILVIKSDAVVNLETPNQMCLIDAADDVEPTLQAQTTPIQPKTTVESEVKKQRNTTIVPISYQPLKQSTQTNQKVMAQAYL